MGIFKIKNILRGKVTTHSKLSLCELCLRDAYSLLLFQFDTHWETLLHIKKNEINNEINLTEGFIWLTEQMKSISQKVSSG